MGEVVIPHLDLVGDDRPSVYREEGLLVVRASSLGGCLWELIATGQGQEPQPWPDKILDAFAAGHEAEPKVLARLEELGWLLEDDTTQREANLRVGANRVVRYHPDATAFVPIDGERRLIEVKALADSSWRKAQLHGVESTYAEYGWQLSAMMLGEGLPGTWVVLNKETDELHFEFVDQPPHGLGEIVQRVKAIAEGIDGPDITSIDRPCDQPDQYPCRFIHLRPEPEKDRPLEVPPEHLEQWLHLTGDYAHAREAEADAKWRKDAARKQLLAIAREGLPDDQPTPTLGFLNGVVRWKQSPRTNLDRKAMAADGIDVAKYETTTISESISVEVV